MKVAHVVCPDGMYGAERWILMLGRHLSRRGVPLVLVTVGDSEGARDVHRRFAATGVPAVRLPFDAKVSPGAIAGLLAQYPDARGGALADVVGAGVLAHASAGRAWRDSAGVAGGMLAWELADHLPRAVQGLRKV